MKRTLWTKVCSVALVVFMLLGTFAMTLTGFAAEGDSATGDTATGGNTTTNTDPSYDVWDGTVDESFALTPGQTEYEITTVAQLAKLAKIVNDAKVQYPGACSGYTFYITKNLDFNGHSWTPIGHTNAAGFGGNLIGKLNNVEGAAITIANFTLGTRETYYKTNNSGLVGSSAGSMKNMIMVNPTIYTSQNTTGFFMGYSRHYGENKQATFENLHVINGTIRSGGATWVGGIVGYTNPFDKGTSVVYKNCSFTGLINAGTAQKVGGLTGEMTHNFTVENVYIGANIPFTGQMAGGIIGVYSSQFTDGNVGTLKNVMYDGSINSEVIEVGSFLGKWTTTTNGKLELENCVNLGISRANYKAQGYSWIGLLAERGKSNVQLIFKNCYSNADIPLAARNDFILTQPNTYLVTLNDAEPVQVKATSNGALKAYKGTVLSIDKFTGAEAATNLTGLDFTDVWATRDGKTVTLKTAVENSFDSAGADLSWFNPFATLPSGAEKLTFNIDTEAKVKGLAKFHKACYNNVYLFEIADSVKSLVTSDLFTLEFMNNSMTTGGVLWGGAEGEIDPDQVDTTFDVWDGVTIDTSWYSEDIPATYYVIDTVEKLAGLAEVCKDASANGKFLGVTFYVTVNMDLGNHQWTPIGCHNSHPFAGMLEGKLGGITGNQVTVKNMLITDDHPLIMDGESIVNNMGLIGTQSGGGCKNFTMLDSKIDTQLNTVASFVGYSKFNTNVYENLYSNATITSGAEKWVGGIVAYSNGPSSTFKNCVYTGTINVTYDMAWLCGGITGEINQSMTFENCYSSATIYTAGKRAAGLFGIVERPNETTSTEVVIKNCQFDGMILGDGVAAGAIIGQLGTATGSTTITLTLENVLNTGVSKNGYEPLSSAFSWIGQIAGAAIAKPVNNATINFTNCYDRTPLKLMAFAVKSDEFPTTVKLNVNGVSSEVQLTALDSLATYMPVVKTTAEMSGDAAKTALTGFDFENVWATREDMIPVLKVARDWAPTTYAKADLSWFDVEGDSFDITTQAELEGYAMLSYVIGGDDFTFNVSEELKAQMAAPLFSERYLVDIGLIKIPCGCGEDCEKCDGYCLDCTCDEGEDETETTAKPNKPSTPGTEASTDDDTDIGENEGCASVVSGTVVIAVMAIGAGFVLARKKED